MKDYLNKELLESKYKEFKSMKKTADYFNVGKTTISYWIKKYDIETTKQKDTGLKKDYFKIIDSEEKAYWLGFLMADGAITKTSKTDKNYNRLYIGLKESDKEHLEKLKKALGSNKDVKTKNSMCYGHESKIATLRINSVDICSDLKLHGVTENKTGKEKIPNINKKYIKDFIRGFFDGDGCIYTQNTPHGKYHSFQIGVSSKDMKDQLEEFFKELNINVFTNIRNNYNIDFFVVGSKKQEYVIKFLNYLYKDATVYLDRKYNQYKEICSPIQ